MANEKVLVIEDRRENLVFLANQILRPNGYEVSTAGDGQTGLDKALAESPDLIIMDLGMPGMGGKKCVEELRKIDPGLKIIIASGYANDESFSNEPLYQPTAYLAKPYKIKNLIQLTRQILSK